MAEHALSEEPDDPRPLIRGAQSHFAAFTEVTEAGGYHITLSVDGVHCAGCIQKIESALQADDAVTYARLNFSTMRLVIEWHGTAEDADRLAAKIEGLGYKVHPYDPRDISRDSERENRFLLTCLGVAGFAAGNVMLLSFALWSTSGEIMGLAVRDFLHLLQALIAVPVVIFSGRPFFRSALAVLKKRRTNMDVPISLALVLTVGMSLLEALRHSEHVYFDSAIMLIFFLLIGRYLDFKARESARSTAGDLLSMMAGTATVIDGEKQTVLPIRDLREGMIVLVGMGERIPADGDVIGGHSELDTSLVTGESVPQPVATGDEVYSGTMNMSAPLTVKVARAAEDSLLADIVRLMEQAEQGQAQYVRLADKAARLYTPVVHTLAAVTFLGWMIFGGLSWQPAMMVAVTVLIITCPCALGLAVPVVQVLAIGKLMKRHVMVKSGDALERLSGIDTVMLDKTGTVTLGRPQLDEANYGQGVMALAASLAAQSRHPLAKALAASWQGQLKAAEVTEHPGKGLSAVIDGKVIKLGSRDWCGDADAPRQPDKLELWLHEDGKKAVPFFFSDRLRPDAADIIKQLQQDGLELYLVSGDRAEAVEQVAKELGITHWRGGVKPNEKFDVLQELHGKGHKILMIGDGLNDTPVLAGADASLSPSSAIDMAQNAADIVFMGDNLAPVMAVLKVARFAQKLVKQNFMLAAAYNMIAVPLAISGHVTPMIAALAMSGSSLVVIANSFRLRLKKL